MEIKKIEILLGKYFEAQTTSEEEDHIIKFFRNNSKLPHDLEQLRPMFEGLSLQGREQPDEGFKRGVCEALDELQTYNAKSRYLRKTYLVAGIAAAIVAGLLYIGVWSSTEVGQDEYYVADTYSDPQQGYEAAKAIMGYVSANYNKGLSQLQSIPSYSDETLALFKALEMYNKGLSKMEVITNINIK
jgi:hypothetical protein